MDLEQILKSRKSIRTYTGQPISDQSRENILKAANLAPVGRALYDTLEIIDVKDKNILEKISKNAIEKFDLEEEDLLYGAPELIIVATNSIGNVGYSNAAIIVHNMGLQAVQEGVGSCYIWGAMNALAENPELIKEIGISDGYTPVAGIILGQSDENYQERTDIEEERIKIKIV